MAINIYSSINNYLIRQWTKWSNQKTQRDRLDKTHKSLQNAAYKRTNLGQKAHIN